ncbi:MAG: hypothetical protein IPF52_07355 [Saprospiraceae bacterium]|nr:hypothetical protein [Saprospiraceae bacterium]
MKNFEVKLKDAERIKVDPVLVPNTSEKVSYSYSVTPVPVDIKYADPEIKALAMPTDDPADYNNGFARAGFGSRKSPFAEAGYHKVRKDIFDWGVYGKYFAVNDRDRILNHKMTDIDLRLNGNYVWKNNLILSADFNNSFKKRYLWNENVSIDSLFEVRDINKVGLHAGIQNISLSKYKLNYKATAGFSTTNVSDQNTLEQSLFIDGQIEKHRTDHLAFVINVRMEGFFLKSEKLKSLFNLKTSPHFILRFGKFKSVLGASALIASDKITIFPKVDLSYPVYKDHVQIFIGSDQKTFTNSIYNLLSINPFMNTNLNKLSNSVANEIYGGVKGEFSFLTYQCNVGYKDVRDQLFFNFDSIDVVRHKAFFDNTRFFFLEGNLEFRILQNVTLGGRININNFKMDTLRAPFHTPDFVISGWVKSSFLDNKVRLSFTTTAMDKYYYIDENNALKKSSFLLDVEAFAEYFPVRNVGIYLKGTNLINSTFQRWYGYRNIGTQISGGVMVTF